jgi:hypothetical protein
MSDTKAPEQPTPDLAEQIVAVKREIAQEEAALYHEDRDLSRQLAAMRAVLVTLEGAAQRAAEAVERERERCSAIVERDSQAPNRATYGELKRRIRSGEQP